MHFRRFIAERQPKRGATQGDVVRENAGRRRVEGTAEKGFSYKEALLTQTEIALRLDLSPD